MKQTASISKTTVLTSRNIILFTLLLTVLLYGNTLRNGYNLDDPLVTEKHRLTSKGISAIPKIFTSYYYEDEQGYKYEYRPLTLTSFAIEHQFFGESPAVSHFINLLFYFFCSLVFVFVLKQLFAGLSEVFIIIPALLFMVHPLHTEVVASIKNRDELLSLLFALLAFYQSLLFFKNGGLWRVLLITIFLISGLLSKSSSISYLFIIPLAGVLMPQTEFKKIGVVLLSVSFVLLIFMALRDYPLTWVFYLLPAMVFVLAMVLLWRNSGFISNIFKAIKTLGLPEQNALIKNSFSELKPVDWFMYSVVAAFCAVACFTNYFLLLSLPLLYLVFSIYWTKSYRADFIILSLVIICISLVFKNPVYSLLYFAVYILLIQNRTTAPNYFWLILHTIILGAITLKFILIGTLEGIFILAGFYIVTYAQKFIKWKYLALIVWLLIIVIHSIGIIEDLDLIRQKDLYIMVFLILIFFYLISNQLKRKAVAFLAALMVIVSFIAGLLFHIDAVFSVVKIQNQKTVISEKNNTENNLNTVNDNGQLENAESVVAFASLKKEDRPLDFAEFPLGFTPTLTEKTGTVSIVMGHYLKMMFYPFPMSFYYGYSEVDISEVTEFWAIISILLHLVIIASGIYFIRSHPLYFLGVIIYLSSIFLFSNLVTPVAGMLGDRLTFIASSGFAIALGYPLAVLFKKLNVSNRKILTGVFSLVIVFFSVKTIARNAQWKTYLTLYRHDVKEFDNSVQIHNLLATRLVLESLQEKSIDKQRKLREEAIIHYKKALEIYPGFFNAQYDLARTYRLLDEGENAIREYKKTIILDSLFTYPYIQIALIYESKNQPNNAIPYYEKFLQLNPGDVQVYFNLSSLYFKQGDFDNAIKTNLKAIEMAPGAYDPVVNVGKTYFTMGDKKNALIYFEKAYQINPNDKNLVITLANIYNEFGEKEKANFYFSKANQFNR